MTAIDFDPKPPKFPIWKYAVATGICAVVYGSIFYQLGFLP